MLYPSDSVNIVLTTYAASNLLFCRVAVSSFTSDTINYGNQFSAEVPAGSPSCGGDATVYVVDVTSRAYPLFLFFDCTSSHKFSGQLSAFSLCSSGLICALLVLSTVCLFMNVSFSPNVIFLSVLSSPLTV